MTPLTYAIQNNSIGERNSLEIVKELLKNENIDINLKDKGGRTPLQIVVGTRNLDVVKELLKQDKIEIDESLISYAIRNGVERGKNFFEKRESEDDKKIDNFRQIACLLIEDKRTVLNKADDLRENLIYLAASRGHEDLLDYLIEKNNEEKLGMDMENI